jgi:hypothetical protein
LHVDRFKERSIPGLFYSADNLTCVAGHKAIFSGRPTRGWMVFTYNQINPDWALHRVWSLGFFAIHHVGEGKAREPAGWHVTFARLVVNRLHRGFSVQWQWADTFSTGKR